MLKSEKGRIGEELVIECLKNVKRYHYVINNVTFLNYKSKMTHQIDHILIHPYGIFIIETKNYRGEISIDNKTGFWYLKNNKRIVRISNPVSQNKSHMYMLYRVLQGNYKVIPVVVFVKNNAPKTNFKNVINLNDLFLFIYSYKTENIYSDNEIDKIKILIDKYKVDVTNEEHISKINKLKNKTNQ